MRKKSLLLLLLPTFIFGCAAKNEIVLDSQDSTPPPAQEIVEEVALEFSKLTLDNVQVATSSVLADTTDTGFNYEASMVLDTDFSTAWCPLSPLGESVTMTFPLVQGGNVMGVLAGFARDEAIFFQNNRVKTINLEFFSGDEVVYEEEFSLKDTYEMQFIVLPKMNFEKINLEVVDVYQGSKYNDTCIAELDLFSPYVLDRDPDAAMAYYLENKAEDALLPYDIVSYVGAIDEQNGNGENCANGYSPPSTIHEGRLSTFDKNYVVAQVNQFGRVGDKMVVKWYYSGDTFYWDDNDEQVYQHFDWRIMKTADVEVLEGCDGKLYAYDTIDNGFILKNEYYFVNPPGGGIHGTYLAEFWHAGKKVGSVEYEGLGS